MLIIRAIILHELSQYAQTSHREGTILTYALEEQASLFWLLFVYLYWCQNIEYDHFFGHCGAFFGLE